jgi:hypothetical protein
MAGMVVLAGGVVEVFRLSRRAREFAEQATYHAGQQRGLLELAAAEDEVVASAGRASALAKQAGRTGESTQYADEAADHAIAAEVTRRRAAYHGRMRTRFERAAARPWETAPVESGKSGAK